jgi:hypothetical protein
MSNKGRDCRPVYSNEPGSVYPPLQRLDLGDKCRGLGIVLGKLQPFGGRIEQRALSVVAWGGGLARQDRRRGRQGQRAGIS